MKKKNWHIEWHRTENAQIKTGLKDRHFLSQLLNPFSWKFSINSITMKPKCRKLIDTWKHNIKAKSAPLQSLHAKRSDAMNSANWVLNLFEIFANIMHSMFPCRLFWWRVIWFISCVCSPDDAAVPCSARLTHIWSTKLLTSAHCAYFFSSLLLHNGTCWMKAPIR